MYKGFPSTFARPIAWLLSIQDPTDPAAIATIAQVVEKQLKERVPEEIEGTGDLRKDLARRRIGGAVDQLQDLRTRARRKGACQEFFALLDLVLAEARQAYERAPSGDPPTTITPAMDDTPPPAEWTQGELSSGASAFDLLPDYLKDI